MSKKEKKLYKNWFAQKAIGVIIIIIGIVVLKWIQTLGGVDQLAGGEMYVDGTVPFVLWAIGGYFVLTRKVSIKVF